MRFSFLAGLAAAVVMTGCGVDDVIDLALDDSDDGERVVFYLQLAGGVGMEGVEYYCSPWDYELESTEGYTDSSGAFYCKPGNNSYSFWMKDFGHYEIVTAYIKNGDGTGISGIDYTCFSATSSEVDDTEGVTNINGEFFYYADQHCVLNDVMKTF